jgi:hypothetical protein
MHFFKREPYTSLLSHRALLHWPNEMFIKMILREINNCSSIKMTFFLIEIVCCAITLILNANMTTLLQVHQGFCKITSQTILDINSWHFCSSAYFRPNRCYFGCCILPSLPSPNQSCSPEKEKALAKEQH